MKISTYFKTLLVALLLVIGSQSMHAIKFKVQLPSDLETFSVQVYDNDTKETYAPEPLITFMPMIFNLPRLSDITVAGKGDYVVTSVTNKAGEKESLEEGKWEHLVLESDEDELYTVTVEQQVQSPSVKFKVQLPSDIETFGVEIYNNDTKETYSPEPLITFMPMIFTLPRLSDIKVYGKGEYIVTSVTNKDGDKEAIEDGKWQHLVLESDEGELYTVVVEKNEQPSADIFTLTVDDASQISAYFGETDRDLILVNGENTVSFDPSVETTLTLESKDYDKDLYSVTLDGVPVEGEYGWYNVPITAGCSIDVKANYPDAPVDVIFNYSENGKGAIANMKVNGEPVDFDGEKLSVKIGDRISFSNDPEYKVTKILCDGVDIWYNSDYGYSKTITAPTVFDVTAAPYAKFSLTINVTDPEQVIVSLGYAGDKIVELTSTSNVITVSENDKYISWKAADGCRIVSAMVNGELRESNGVTPAENMVIDIESKVIEMDMSSVVWIDNRPEEVYYFDLDNSYTHTNIMKNAQSGYTILSYNEDFNPFTLVFSVNQNFRVVGKVFVNNTEIENENEYGYRFSLSLKDKDIVKVFLMNQPEECKVEFEIEDGIEMLVMHDVIATLENPEDGLTCFKGTQISLTPLTADKTIIVDVNGTELQPEDGRYIFTVDNEAVKVNVKEYNNGVTGIENENTNVEIFNMQGMRLGNSIQVLAPGIYIMNGKKVVVK